MIVADTDVLIDFLRGKGPLLDRVELELRRGTLATTAVTVFELSAGARSTRQRNTIETLLQAMAVWPLTVADARRAGEIHRTLRQGGNEVPMADCLIAGICLLAGASLLTRNRRHFERVPELELV